jgi:hypothetical protein
MRWLIILAFDRVFAIQEYHDELGKGRAQGGGE